MAVTGLKLGIYAILYIVLAVAATTFPKSLWLLTLIAVITSIVLLKKGAYKLEWKEDPISSIATLLIVAGGFILLGLYILKLGNIDFVNILSLNVTYESVSVLIGGLTFLAYMVTWGLGISKG